MRDLIEAVRDAVVAALITVIAALAWQADAAAGHSAGPPFGGKLVLVVLQDKAHPATRAGRTLWALQRPLTYRTHAGDTITAPAGMVTDLASIPAAVSWLLPPDGPWVQAAVIHDELYITQGSCLWHGHPGRSRARPYSRAEADAILRDAMADLGLSGWREWAIYTGVRAGGQQGWGT